MKISFIKCELLQLFRLIKTFISFYNPGFNRNLLNRIIEHISKNAAILPYIQCSKITSKKPNLFYQVINYIYKKAIVVSNKCLSYRLQYSQDLRLNILRFMLTVGIFIDQL